MKNILITGGAGFIGSHLANSLVEKGYNVTILDCLLEKIHGKNPELESYSLSTLDPKVNLIVGSVNVREEFQKALIDQDAIFHFAAETGTGESMYRTASYANANIGGTAVLLDLLINGKHSIKKLILASSRAVYGEGKYHCDEHGIVYPDQRSSKDLKNGIFEVRHGQCSRELEYIPSDEDSMLKPISVYGISKQTQEQLVTKVCESLGVATVIFRYQNVYGPGQSLLNPYTGILSIFSTLIMNGEEVEVFEDGLETRDFVYIKDAIAATILGLEKNEADGQVFNVGSTESTSVLSVAKILSNYFKRETSIKITSKYRVGDVRHCRSDITRISQILDYKTNFTFAQGVEEFTKWVLKNRFTSSKLSKSFKEMESRGLMR